MSKLLVFTPNLVDSVWETYKPLIQKALDRGSNYTIDDIYAGLKSGDMRLWAWDEDAALVTTVQNKDDKRWLLLLALGGKDMNVWKGFLPILENYARFNRCDELRIYGRIGWKKLGFDVEYTKLVRSL